MIVVHLAQELHFENIALTKKLNFPFAVFICITFQMTPIQMSHVLLPFCTEQMNYSLFMHTEVKYHRLGLGLTLQPKHPCVQN